MRLLTLGLNFVRGFDEAKSLEKLRALGLRPEKDRSDRWRCGRCSTWVAGEWQVMMPDDSEHARDIRFITSCVNSWNGHSTGWCLPCAARVLSLPDVDAEIERLRKERMAHRVDALAKHGEEAQNSPSNTKCGECDGTAGYSGGSMYSTGGTFRSVMCPRCGWSAWEKVSDKGMTWNQRDSSW